jgi:predicted nucleic acid-binding protein
MKPICIDANVFIASTKGDEKYSSDCRRVIQAVLMVNSISLSLRSA